MSNPKFVDPKKVQEFCDWSGCRVIQYTNRLVIYSPDKENYKEIPIEVATTAPGTYTPRKPWHFPQIVDAEYEMYADCWFRDGVKDDWKKGKSIRSNFVKTEKFHMYPARFVVLADPENPDIAPPEDWKPQGVIQ